MYNILELAADTGAADAGEIKVAGWRFDESVKLCRAVLLVGNRGEKPWSSAVSHFTPEAMYLPFAIQKTPFFNGKQNRESCTVQRTLKSGSLEVIVQVMRMVSVIDVLGV